MPKKKLPRARERVWRYWDDITRWRVEGRGWGEIKHPSEIKHPIKHRE